MQITRNNYESYFVDFVEGNLPPGLLAEMQGFLSLNPDLANELIDFQSSNEISLPVSTISFPDKDNLLKPEGSSVYDRDFNRWAVARMEGDLNEIQARDFDHFLQNHPHKLREYQLFLATRLKPDYNLVFSGKAGLRHFSLFGEKKFWWISSFSIAASVLIIMGLLFFFQQKEMPGQENTISELPVKPVMPAVDSKIQAPVDSKITSPKDPLKKKAQPSKKKVSPKAKIESLPKKQHSAPFQPILSRPEKSMISDHLLAENDKPTPKTVIPEQKIKESQHLNNPVSEVISKPAQSQQLASILPKPKQAPVESMTLGRYLLRLFNRKVLDRDTDNDVSAWDLADASAEKVNKMTGTKLKVERKTDSQGRLVAFNIGTSNFGISKNH